MSSNPNEVIGTIIDQALIEINIVLGYNHFEKHKRDEIKEQLLKLSPIIEKNILIPIRGVALKDLEKETPDYEKCKRAAITGFMDGHILKNYSGLTYKQKFENYLYNAGLNHCKWIKNTSHDEYYHSLLRITFKIRYNDILVKKIWNFCLSKTLSTSQSLIPILSDQKFFDQHDKINDLEINDYIARYKILSPILETYLKLLYGIKYNFKDKQTELNLDKIYTFTVIDNLRKDSDYMIFTKSFSNTIYFNASKHNGISRRIDKRIVKFDTNEGTKELTYEDFMKLVREMYACVAILMKINMFINFQTLR